MTTNNLIIIDKMVAESPQSPASQLSDNVPAQDSLVGTAGTGSQGSRSDHSHPTPTVALLEAASQVSSNSAELVPSGAISSTGIVDKLIRVDHVHPQNVASTTIVGEVQLATGAVAKAGTSVSTAVMPSALAEVVQSRSMQIAAVTGTSDALIFTCTPVITALADGMEFDFVAAGTNTIINPTVVIDTLPAKVVVKNANEPLAIGDLVTGVAYKVRYSATYNALVITQGVQVDAVGIAVQLNSHTTQLSQLRTYQIISANYTAAENDKLLVDTSGGAVTVTLPAAPITGEPIHFADSAKSFDTNNLTLDPNGNTVEDVAGNAIAAVAGLRFALAYNGTTWRFV